MQKTNPKIVASGPRIVKSSLVVKAKTVMATTTAVVSKRAYKQIFGSTIAHIDATIQLTHKVKIPSKTKLVGTFLSYPQHTSPIIERK